MNQIHIIYIPGLGNRYDALRSSSLLLWSRFLSPITFVPMQWQNSSETHEEKIKRIREAISHTETKNIVIVGESAGASMALAVSEDDTRIKKVITLCGKTIRADRLSSQLYKRNPAFRNALLAADQAASRRTDSSTPVVAFFAYADHVVRPVDMKVRGAVLKRLPTFGHIVAIVSVLVLLWPIVDREARK